MTDTPLKPELQSIAIRMIAAKATADNAEAQYARQLKGIDPEVKKTLAWAMSGRRKLYQPAQEAWNAFTGIAIEMVRALQEQGHNDDSLVASWVRAEAAAAVVKRHHQGIYTGEGERFSVLLNGLGQIDDACQRRWVEFHAAARARADELATCHLPRITDEGVIHEP